MNIKNTTVLFLLLSISVFSQKEQQTKEFTKVESNISYLDSIKKSFVNDAMASRVDSLWLDKLTSLDIYSDLEKDIQTINMDDKVDYELPTELLKERLAAMDAKSPFNIEYNQGLENIIKSFLKNRKKSFEHLMAVSEYYFPLFEEAFAKQNVPLEIKYLAVVESALNPKAVSKMGATGLWQFMYETGKQYKLGIDSYVDERRDPLKSSAAAAQYMTNMFGVLNDWDLVLASYNSGPGNVSKAIRRSGGQQNYWNIRKNLPKETQGYVPAFLATMYIYEYHNEHGIKPDRAIVKHFATDTIRIKNQMTFKQISDLLDVPVAQLELLNPSYKLNVVPSYKDKSHYLRLPQEKIAVFASNEEKIYAYAEHVSSLREKPFQRTKAIATKDSILQNTNNLAHSTTKYYKIKKGDNLGSISETYGVAIADIKKWNHLKSNALTYGKSLRIVIDEKDNKTMKANSKLSKIVSDRMNETQIASNDTKNNAVVKGDTLSSKGSDFYVVQKGDNLASISKKFGTSVADLKQWNNLNDANIALGSNLVIAKNEIATNLVSVDSFKKKDNMATSQKVEADYYVKKGDSLYSISKKYPGVTISDLKKWNDINGEDLKPGMKLKING